MTAAVETLAYVKDRGVPWHGLGVPADGLMTAGEVLEKAGLAASRAASRRHSSEKENRHGVPDKPPDADAHHAHR